MKHYISYMFQFAYKLTRLVSISTTELMTKLLDYFNISTCTRTCIHDSFVVRVDAASDLVVDLI